MVESSFAAVLLRWYDCAARDLPWRQDKDPYRPHRQVAKYLSDQTL